MKAFCLLFCLVLMAAIPAALKAEAKQIVGWIEKAKIFPGGLALTAKLDTGADNSSLDASQVTEFERDGETWVRFQVINDDGRTATLERKLVRTAAIKRHRGARQQRPVVRLGICVGNFYRETEVNLVDRTRFKYQLLVGRSFMQGQLVVDPAAAFTVAPRCTGREPNFE